PSTAASPRSSARPFSRNDDGWQRPPVSCIRSTGIAPRRAQQSFEDDTMTTFLQERFLLGGKVAAISGGGDGIGKAAAHHLAAAGASVAILDRDGAKAEAVAQSIRDAGG